MIAAITVFFIAVALGCSVLAMRSRSRVREINAEIARLEKILHGKG